MLLQSFSGRIVADVLLSAALAVSAAAQARKEAAPAKPAAAPAQKGGMATATSKKDEPVLTSPHAILIEAETGSVLYEKQADDLIFPASLAKLMTTEYVF